MKIGIISDIHDNIPKLREALKRLVETETVICCGDLCSPFIIRELGLGYAGPIHVVFGNNDGDRYRMALAATKYPNVQLHGEFAELELGGKRFAVVHFDNIGHALGETGTFDVVCYGHNHKYQVQVKERQTIINPGEVFGLLTGRATCALYDTNTGEVTGIEL